ncbi:hypothetical protein ACJX0J_008264 [Zea mays]
MSSKKSNGLNISIPFVCYMLIISTIFGVLGIGVPHGVIVLGHPKTHDSHDVGLQKLNVWSSTILRHQKMNESHELLLMKNKKLARKIELPWVLVPLMIMNHIPKQQKSHDPYFLNNGSLKTFGKMDRIKKNMWLSANIFMFDVTNKKPRNHIPKQKPHGALYLSVYHIKFNIAFILAMFNV